MKSLSSVPHTAALLLLVLIALPDQAAAQTDVKSWSGAVCRPYGSTDASNFFLRAESIENVSDSELWVVCPITRDSEDNVSSFTLYIEGVRDLNHNNVLCTVTVGSVFVGQVLSTITKSDSLFSTGWSLNFGPVPVTLNNANRLQPVTAKCRLQPHMQLGSLTLRETAKTDTP